jgi:pyridoxine/pyridoxamine 5'-phosphate oxidase
VFCTVATVDARGRPRSRILHPIFVVEDRRPVGWALTGRSPLKTRHLAANPHVSCSYWSPSHDTVFADCVAEWVEDEAEKERVWHVFHDTPMPLGWVRRAWRLRSRPLAQPGLHAAAAEPVARAGRAGGPIPARRPDRRRVAR